MPPPPQSISTQVLVVGGGPVGLVLAMCLARHGVAVTVAEQRARGEPPSVKCNHISARSMEILRQLGIAEAVRNCGLPPGFVNDVAFRTTITVLELARISIPSRAHRFTDKTGPDGGWPTPEPPHRANQIYVEPVLQQCAEAMGGIHVLYRCQVLDCEQDENGVVVERLSRLLIQLLEAPATREKFAREGLERRTSTPEGFAATLRADTQRWSRIIKAARISLG